MDAPALTQPLLSGMPVISAPPAVQWIISRKDDLIWFIGSALIGYLALGLMAAGFPIQLIYLVWVLGVDGPHVIGTVTRTYFDRNERIKLGWWLWVIIPFIAVGPAMVALGQGSLFFLFAVCWQHYHIAKQHIGLIMLWKAKNKERDAWEREMDKRFLLASTTLPLALFVVQTRLPAWPVLQGLEAAAVVAYLGFASYYVYYQIRKFQAKQPLNIPKLLLLGVLTPLQWLAFYSAAKLGANGILLAGISLGLFHSLQYHRLLWFHNRNRYQVPDADRKFGAAAYFAKNWVSYIVAAIVLHFVLTQLPQLLFPGALIGAAIWGFAFTHYVLDARIWHVRGDRELAAALRM